MPFKTPCPACGNSLQVPEAATGKRVKCPTCEHVWAIPQPNRQTDPFGALCPLCKNSLQVPGEAVGKRAKCPVCQHVWVISRPVAAAVVTEQPKSWFDEAIEDVHPATRPQAASAKTTAAASRSAEAVKLWRDGKYLVVDIRASEFPACCVKTGEPTTTTHRIQLAWVDRSKTWGVSLRGAFGPLGRLSAARAIERMKTKFSLRVGLSPKWLAMRRIKRWIAWAAVAVGVAVMMFGLRGFVGPAPAAHGKFPVVAVLGGLVFAIGWVALDCMSDRSVLGVYTMDGNYAWLVGVHRDFLDRLEPWNE